MSTALSPGPESMAVHLLLLDGDGRRMLAREGSGTAPVFRTAPAFYPEVEEPVRKAREAYGLDIAVLRCLEEGDANRGRPRLYSALCVSDDAPSPGFAWTELDEPKFDQDGAESLAEMARLEVERLSSPAPARAPVPWDSPSEWHSEARGWVEANLPRSPGASEWRMAQIRSWSISSVWRLTRGGSRLYFKASPSYFASEVAVTRDVANHFPDASPALVAVEPERGWTLMEDLGDLTLAKADSADMWRETMRTIARVQRGYVERPESLEGMNLERRTTRAIIESLESWLKDPSRSALRTYQPENEKALGRLEPSLGAIDSMARGLDELGLPQTLEHGDLDSTNVFIRNGAPVLMDWSDACISHPFFTPLTPAQARRYPQFVAAYLREWAGHASPGGLRRGFEFAKPLAALESAFHYHRNIVPYLPFGYPDFRTLERYIPALLDMAAEALEYTTGME